MRMESSEAISPELVLVDPELRKLALSALAPLTATRHARTLSHQPTRSVSSIAPPTPPRQRARQALASALGASALANVILIVLLADGAPVARSPLALSASTSGTTIALEPRVSGRDESKPRARTAAGGSDVGERTASPPAQPTTGTSGQAAILRAEGRGTAPIAALSRGRVERDVLRFLSESRELPQFLDTTTGLVKANVAVRCKPARTSTSIAGSGTFRCVIWQQSEGPTAGTTVVYERRPEGNFTIRAGPGR